MKVVTVKLEKRNTPVACNVCGDKMVLSYYSVYKKESCCSRHYRCDCGNTWSTWKECNEKQMRFLL